MYHISDLKKFIKCKRKFYLEIDEQFTFYPYLRLDNEIYDLLIKYLNIDYYFEGKVGDKAEYFFNEKDNYNWFIKTRFEINDLRFNIPILHKDEDIYEIYFLYYGSNINAIDFFTYQIILEALKDIGLNINEVYIIYLNENYIYEKELMVDKLFIKTNKYNNKRLISILHNFYFDYKNIIKEMKEYSFNNLPLVELNNCKEKKTCKYFGKCFEEFENIEDNSIINLFSSQHKYKMYQNGIKYLKDIDLSKANINKTQYSQIMADRNGGLFVDSLGLKKWMSKIKYPISFLDFEWDRYLVPKYEMMKPLSALCFEYALYIKEENQELKNYTFIGTKDCRKDFIEDLISKLPKTGSILAYNAKGAECLRLKELADYYPQYKKEINEIITRFIDLSEPFSEGLVYDLKMAGNFSLKKLIEVVSDFSYENLDITNGMEAVFSWRDIDKGLPIDEVILEDLKNIVHLMPMDYIWFTYGSPNVQMKKKKGAMKREICNLWRKCHYH